MSVHYIESRNCSPEVLDLALTKLSQTGSEIPENFYELFAAILQIMQLFLRTPKGTVREDELRECLKELRFTDECIDDITKVLHNHRDSLTQNYCEVKSLRTPPKRFQWCINLSLVERLVQLFSDGVVSSISSVYYFCSAFCNCSGVARVAQPIIVFHILLRNGEYKTFEVPIVMFHRLRYAIACLLKDFQALEGRQILRK